MVGRWAHVAVRLFEQSILVTLDGRHVMTVLDASPWVNTTGFYASSVSTVANPKAPVPTRAFSFDFLYWNYVLSDAEVEAHRARGMAFLDRLRPTLFHNVDCALLLLDRDWNVHHPLYQWTALGPDAQLEEAVRLLWAQLASQQVCAAVKPALSTPNITSDMFYYYPCVPRQESVALTSHAYEPLPVGHISVPLALLDPAIPEYSVAFWLYLFASPAPAGARRTLVAFHGSWRLLVANDGSRLELEWDDALLPERSTQRVTLPMMPPLVRRWAHVALRLWETFIDVVVDGATVKRIVSASPVVRRTRVTLGALDPNAPPTAALFYKAAYFNHIFSDEQLTAHRTRGGVPGAINTTTTVDALVASDALERRGFNVIPVAVALLVVALALAVRHRERLWVRRQQLCTSCSQWRAPTDFEPAACCLPCKRALAERQELERQQQASQQASEAAATYASMRGNKKDKLRKKQRELDEALERVQSLEARIKTATDELEVVRARAADADAYAEQIRALRRAERELTQRAEADRHLADRELALWRQHQDTVRARERLAREELVPVMAAFETFANQRNIVGFLQRLYSAHPPKDAAHQLGALEPPLDRALKLALVHYHPDRSDVVLHGVHWVIFCEGICTILNAMRAKQLGK